MDQIFGIRWTILEENNNGIRGYIDSNGYINLNGTQSEIEALIEMVASELDLIEPIDILIDIPVKLINSIFELFDSDILYIEVKEDRCIGLYNKNKDKNIILHEPNIIIHKWPIRLPKFFNNTLASCISKNKFKNAKDTDKIRFGFKDRLKTDPEAFLENVFKENTGNIGDSVACDRFNCFSETVK
jgi:hypothetical protein